MRTTTLPASSLHPVFAQILANTQQAYGMKPAESTDPEQLRQLLGQQPAQSEHSADAI